jgi:hypothetical protein
LVGISSIFYKLEKKNIIVPMKTLFVLCMVMVSLCIMTMARPQQDFDVGNYLFGDFI